MSGLLRVITLEAVLIKNVFSKTSLVLLTPNLANTLHM